MALRCVKCGFENQPGTARCELCGQELSPALAAKADDHPHRVPTGLKRVPAPIHRDQALSQNPTQTGAADRSSTPVPFPVPDPSPEGPTPKISASGPTTYTGAQQATAPPPLLGKIKLVVEQGMIIGEQYLLSEPRMVIGRSDPSSSIYPDIDLTGQDNEYVHRRHALLQFYDLDTRLSVEHVGGTNPTLVNNQPVEAGELVELKIGDRLRIGRVVMRLTSI